MTKKTFYSYIALLFVILFLSLLFAGGVRADAGQPYIGIGGHYGTYDEGWMSTNLTGAQVKGGVYLVDNFAAELRYVIGWGSYSGIDLTGEAVTFFFKGDIPVSEKAAVYGLIGYSKTWMTAEFLGYSASMSDTGMSFGGGVEFDATDDLKVGAELISYQDQEYYDYIGVNVTLTILF